MQNFEETIRKLLREKNMNIRDFSKEVGISDVTLYKIFKRDSIETKHLERMSEVLDVPVSVFFDEAPGMIAIGRDEFERVRLSFDEMIKVFELYKDYFTLVRSNYSDLRKPIDTMTTNEKQINDQIEAIGRYIEVCLSDKSRIYMFDKTMTEDIRDWFNRQSVS